MFELAICLSTLARIVKTALFLSCFHYRNTQEGRFWAFCQNPQKIRKLLSLIKNLKICSIKLTYLLRIYHFFTFFDDDRKNFDSLSNFFAKSYPRQIIF